MGCRNLVSLLAVWILIVVTTGVVPQCEDTFNEVGRLQFDDYGGLAELYFLFRFKYKQMLTCCVDSPSGITVSRVWSADGSVLTDETGNFLYIPRPLTRKKQITCTASVGTQTITRTFTASSLSKDFTEEEPKCPTVDPRPGNQLRFRFEEYNVQGTEAFQSDVTSTYNTVMCCSTSNDNVIWRRNGVVVNDGSSSCAIGGGHFYDDNQVYVYLAPSQAGVQDLIECEVIRGSSSIKLPLRTRQSTFRSGTCNTPHRHEQTTITAELGEESFVEVAFSAECPWDEVKWLGLDERTGESILDMSCLGKTDRFQTFLRFKSKTRGAQYSVRIRAAEFDDNHLFCLRGIRNGTESELVCNHKEIRPLKYGSSDVLKCGATPSGSTTWTLNGTEILQETSGELTITPELHGIITCRPTEGSGEIKTFRVIYLADEFCPSLEDTKYAPFGIASFRSCDNPPSLTYCCAYGADGVRWKAYGDTSNKVLGTGQILENVEPGTYVCEAYKGTETDTHVSVVERSAYDGISVEYVQLDQTEATQLSCNLESPTSSYNWTFSGYPIEMFANSSFQTVQNGLFLTVPAGFAGKFGCSAATCNGDVATKSFVVEDWECTPAEGRQAVEREGNIQSQRWKIGYYIPDCEPITLQCCSKSVKKITWFYNGNPLKTAEDANTHTSNDNVTFAYELGGQALILLNHPPGTYTCQVEPRDSSFTTGRLTHYLNTRDSGPTSDKCEPGCAITDVNFFIPAEMKAENRYAQVGDTITWKCGSQNRCRFSGGARAYWDVYNADGAVRSCTIDVPVGNLSIRCGNRLDVSPTCEAVQTDGDPLVCDSRFSGIKRRWADRYSHFIEQTLTIENVQLKDFNHSYRCVLSTFGSPVPREYRLQLIQGEAPTAAPVTIERTVWKEVRLTITIALPLILLMAVLVYLFYWPLKLFLQRCFAKPLPTKYHTFLCYSATNPVDEEAAITLMAGTLEQHGLSVCIPPRDFLIGAAQSEEISRSLQESSSLLALVTPSFLETGWCDLALDLALKSNLPIVIILYDIDNTVWKTYQKKKLNINLNYQYGVKMIRWPGKASLDTSRYGDSRWHGKSLKLGRQYSRSQSYQLDASSGGGRSKGYFKKRATERFWYKLQASLPNFSSGKRNGV